MLLILFSTATFADDGESDELLIPDLLVGKPLGFVTLGLGTVTYVVSLPITLPFGWEKSARRALFTRPYQWTFRRGLGEELDKF